MSSESSAPSYLPGFSQLAARQLAISILVSPLDKEASPSGSSAKRYSDPGGGQPPPAPLPFSVLGLTPVILDPGDPRSTHGPGATIVPLSGHVRVLGIRGVQDFCDRNIVIFLFADAEATGETICEMPAYLVRLPRDIKIPFVDLEYGSSLTDELRSGASCNGDGSSISLSGSFDPGQRSVSLRVDARARLVCKVLGNKFTVFDVSGHITVTLRVSELPICGIGNADIDVDFLGVARFKAKACYGGSYVQISDACLYASYNGNDYQLVCAGPFQIPIPAIAQAPSPSGCGCK